MVLVCGMVPSFDGLAAWASIGIAILVQVCAHDTGPLVYFMVELLLCMLLRIDLNHGMRILELFNATITINTTVDRLGRSHLEFHKEVSVPSRRFHNPNNKSSADDISIPCPNKVFARLWCHSQAHPNLPSHVHLGSKFSGDVIEELLAELDCLLVSPPAMQPLVCSLSIVPNESIEDEGVTLQDDPWALSSWYGQ